MKFRSIFFLFIILVASDTLMGQVSDTSKLAQSAPIHGKLLNNIPDSTVLLEILKIQVLRIDNLNYMIDYLFEDQKRIEAKLDSLISILQKENHKCKMKRKKRLGKSEK